MDFNKLLIVLSSSILCAMKYMDTTQRKLLIVVDDHGFYCGLLSIGDIQRAILHGMPLDREISEVLRSDYIIAKPEDSKDEIKKIMLFIRAEFMPVVNEQREIVDVIFWEDIFEKEKPIPIDKFDLPVVIMAGGYGSRVRPLTNVFPKPLLPIGEKSMLEEIFSRFYYYGSKRFYISVNYKAELIEFYLSNQNLPYSIEYFKEEKPLGTAGSLHLLRGKLDSAFFVSNCDILIDQDYSAILQYHREQKNEITLVSALKNIDIPYGTLNTGMNGVLESLSEKPSFTFQLNSGMYILEPSVLNDIPENEFFHITQLIEKLMIEKRKVGVFPVSEKSWLDMGTLNDYIKIITMQNNL
ncbi:MAG: CBS domain-containing protein [Bacteroidetes bacterium]|nr:CBS domain-containing protein [Bacteroidota bacterium]